MYTGSTYTVHRYYLRLLLTCLFGHIKSSRLSDVIQNKAMQYFLVVHGFTPVLALNGEIGWLPS